MVKFYFYCYNLKNITALIGGRMSLRSKRGNSLVKGFIIFAICAFGSVGLLILSDNAVNNTFFVAINFINKIQNTESINIKDLRASSITHISTIDTKVWRVENNLINVKSNKEINKPKIANIIKKDKVNILTPVNSANKTVLHLKETVKIQAQSSKPEIEIVEQQKTIDNPVLDIDKPIKAPVVAKQMSPIVVTHMIVSKSSGKELFSADIPATSVHSDSSNYALKSNPVNSIATMPNTKYFKKDDALINDN